MTVCECCTMTGQWQRLNNWGHPRPCLLEVHKARCSDFGASALMVYMYFENLGNDGSAVHCCRVTTPKLSGFKWQQCSISHILCSSAPRKALLRYSFTQLYSEGSLAGAVLSIWCLILLCFQQDRLGLHTHGGWGQEGTCREYKPQCGKAAQACLYQDKSFGIELALSLNL